MVNRKLAKVLPYRLRHPYLRRSRITAIQCLYCHQWLKPRYIRFPACVCRRCEKAGANQTWKPSRAHLERAYALAAREQAIRNAGRRRDGVTLAGR
jgi:hypothetical protein